MIARGSAALIALAAAASLASCNGSAPAGNSAADNATAGASAPATAESPAAAETPATVTGSTAPLELKPGKWEHTATLVDTKAPDMPPAVLQAMKDMKPQKVTSCITQADIAKGVAGFLANDRMKKVGCTFGKVEMAGGKLASEMHCTRPDGEMTVTSSGTYSSTEYTVDAQSEMKGKRSMTQKTHTTGKWVGECDGTEMKAPK